jgi:DNA primase
MNNYLNDIFPGLDIENLLEDLLGATNLQMNNNEIIHSCTLNFGLHGHGDQNPSASINKESLLFNCHVCGGGTIIWLVQNVLDLSKNEAIDRIKNYSEMLRPIPVEQFVFKLDKMLKDRGLPKELLLPRYSDKILNEWAQPSEYLLERGVSYEVQKEMRTGIMEPHYELDKSTKQPILVKRNILPHFIDNDLVGWVSRRLDDTQNVAKYRNTRGFPRKYSLYNLNNIVDNNHCYVVESPMSVLVLKSRGINDVVASFGAQVSDEQCKILRRFDNLTVWSDGDKAGFEGANGLYRRLREYSKVRLVLSPDGEDPATLEDIPKSITGVEFAMTTRGKTSNLI